MLSNISQRGIQELISKCLFYEILGSCLSICLSVRLSFSLSLYIYIYISIYENAQIWKNTMSSEKDFIYRFNYLPMLNALVLKPSTGLNDVLKFLKLF